MKKKYKILIVCCFVATLLCALCVFPSAEENTRAVERPPDETLTTLPAGSYTFKNVPTIPDALSTNLVQGVNFAFSVVLDRNSYLSIENGTQIVFDNSGTFTISYVLNIGQGVPVPTTFVAYTASDGWTDDRFLLPHRASLNPPLQEIYINDSTEVPRWFYNWIMSNSTYNPDGYLVELEAGLYRAPARIDGMDLPDNPSADGWYSCYLPFKSTAEYQGLTYTFDVIQFYQDLGTMSTTEIVICYWNTDVVNSIEEVYDRVSSHTSYTGWMQDSFRYLTITHDFYVPHWFYDLFLSVYESTTAYQSGYTDGYNAGYSEGIKQTDTYKDGYQQGFKDGEGGYSGIFSPFVDGVFKVLDSWTFFGSFSLWDFLVCVMTALAMVWLLKLVAGG